MGDSLSIYPRESDISVNFRITRILGVEAIREAPRPSRGMPCLDIYKEGYSKQKTCSAQSFRINFGYNSNRPHTKSMDNHEHEKHPSAAKLTFIMLALCLGVFCMALVIDPRI